MVFRFEELDIWKLAMEYANELYDIAEKFPSHEMYALGSQLRRAAVSIPTNIAEGSGAVTTKDFCNYLDVSVKSGLETVSLMYFAAQKKYVKEEIRQSCYNKVELLIKKTRAFKKSL